MSHNNQQIAARDWMLLGILSVLWGGSFFFNRVALTELPPLTIVFLRVALAALLLLAVALIARTPIPTTAAGWRPFFAIAILNNVIPFSLIVAGQTMIGSGLAAVVNATTPMFTVLVMAAAGEEKLLPRRIVGVVAGLLGVVILRGDALSIDAGQSIGVALCLGAALSYGLAALYARRRLADAAPLTTATCQLIASSGLMAVLAAAIDRPWRLPLPNVATWGAIGGLATLSTALAYILFFQILRRSGSTNVMLVTLLVPVTAILLGTIVLNEAISVREVAGAVVIGSALLIIDGRLLNGSIIRR